MRLCCVEAASQRAASAAVVYDAASLIALAAALETYILGNSD